MMHQPTSPPPWRFTPAPLTETNIMKTFQSAAHFAAEKARIERITNPPKPAPKFDGVKALRRAQFAGRPANVGQVIPIWPASPPPGWLSLDEARELVESGLAAPAAAEELAAFLDANDEKGGAA